nr:mechanosensitive ion channel domain-containing protein [Saccharobesus litoralis]
MAADWAINIVIAIAIFVVGRIIAKSVGTYTAKGFAKNNVDAAVASFISNIVYALILAATVLVALGQLGIETTSFVAILGAAGLAVGLALKDSLSNFASGVLIIMLRPFKAGDYVEAGGVAGSVQKIEVFSTTLKTPDNKVVIVPNASITGGSITNFSREETRRIDLVIGVSYDADLKQTKQVLIEQIEAQPLVLKEPAYTVAVSELGDSSVNFVVRPWVKTSDFWKVKFALVENIKIALDDAGINIPYPQMDVHIKKED